MTEPEKTSKTIGEIVAEDYRTSAVFEKYGIDFCCGGGVALTAVCQENNLDCQIVQQEIEAAKSEPLDRSQNYAAWDLSFLADYIVNTHHGYLNEEMAPIAAYAHKISDVHGAKHPEVIKIAAIFDKIVSDMTGHLVEEEEVLFPGIKRAEAAKKKGEAPVKKDREIIRISLGKLQVEHEEIGDAVHEIRHLANNYAIPEDVCNTFVVTYKKLKEFEDDLHRHVHLENNILFLKAMEL